MKERKMRPNLIQIVFMVIICLILSSCNQGARITNIYPDDEAEPILLYLSIRNKLPALISFNIEMGIETELVTEMEILDYAPAWDGSAIVFSSENSRRGSDLWHITRDGSDIDLLLDCGPDRCATPVWSSTGRRIAYSRETANPNSITGFDPPRLWTADPDSGATSVLIDDNHILQGQPSWSPDDRWLAFYDLVVEGIRVLDLRTSSEQMIPTGFGVVGSWSPDGSQLIFPVLVHQGDQFLVTLQRVDLVTKEIQIVIGESMNWLDIGVPRWSPSGEWIVVGVRSGEFGEGRQLWLFRPDGTDAHTIVEDPNYTHGGHHWDPHGERIVFQRFLLGDAGAQPEVVLWETDWEVTLIASNAWLPEWLPSFSSGQLNLGGRGNG